MEPVKDLAITLRWVPYEERHRVVTALTETHGKISALARNSIQSRRFGGALEPFAAAEWRLVERPGADLYRVEGAEIRRSFEGLRRDFERLSMASAFNELILRLAPERQPCPELFKLHSNALAALEEMEGAVPVSLINAYLAKALQWSGNQPQLHHCLQCGTPVDALRPDQAINVVVADAGWICCGSRRDTQAFHHLFRQVTPAALRDFHKALSVPIRQVPSAMKASSVEHKALYAFLESLMMFHVPGFDRAPLKSTRFLDLDAHAHLAPGPGGPAGPYRAP